MLSVDNLLQTIREMLESEAESPTEMPELILSGVPADETMRKVMQAKGGRFVIKICELPKEMSDTNYASNIMTYRDRINGLWPKDD